MRVEEDFALPEIDRAEVLRYAGHRGEEEEIGPLLDECIKLCEGAFSPRVVSLCCDTCVENNIVKIEGLEVESRGLAGLLEGTKKTVLFCATVGFEIDRLIMKYGEVSPSRALILQAIGAERVEALCDVFCGGFENRTPRKSPGYGDIPLEMQADIVRLLDTGRKIGVSLGEGMLLSPKKTVTAVFGIK